MNYPDDMDFRHIDGELDDAIEEVYRSDASDVIVAAEFADTLDATFYRIIESIVTGRPIQDGDIDTVNKLYRDSVIKEAKRRLENDCRYKEY